MSKSITSFFTGLLLLCYATSSMANLHAPSSAGHAGLHHSHPPAWGGLDLVSHASSSDADLMDIGLGLTSVGGAQGTQVCMDVTVTNFTDIIGMQFSINYNPAQLTFVSVGNFNLSGLNASGVGTPGAGSVPLGVISVSWTDPTLAGVTVPGGTAIFQTCFTITGSTNTTVSFSSSPTTIEFTNAALQNVPSTTTNSTVTVTGGGNPMPSNLGLSVTNVSGAQGAQVCMEVRANDFASIISTQFSMSYNPAHLQFVSVGNFNLPGLNASSFGTPATGTIPGIITHSWMDNTFNGVTLPNGARLFEVCFTILGTTNATVSFSNTPANIESTRVGLQNVPVTTTNGTVTVTGGGGGGPVNNNFTLSLTNVSGQQGAQVCMDVRADNFTDIIGAQLSLNYNPAQLQFVSLGNFNLTGLVASNFGTPSGGTAPGVISMSWTDPALTGVTVANGTALFQVCFTILGTTNATVSFSNTPANIEVTRAGLQNVPVTTTNGTVTVTGGGGPVNNNFTLSLTDVSGQQGAQVCMDVRADNFTDIIGAQLSLNYNPAQLQFVSLGNFNLLGLVASNFGTPSGGTAPGVISMSWTDPALTGVTVANGTALFQVCFTILGTTNATVSFSNTPANIEVTRAGLQNVPVTTNNGTVTVTGGGGPVINGFTLSLTNVTGQQGQQVCMDVVAHNFTDIIGVQLSLNYNPAQLQFVSLGNLNLLGLVASNFGTPTTGTAPGVISMSWTDPALTGVTVANGTALFQVCFTILGTTNSTVSFSNMPANIEVTRAGLQNVPVTTNNGTVTVGSVPNTQTTMVSVGTATAATGAQVCLPVRVTNFTNMESLAFTANYTPAQLSFASVGAFNLAGLSAAQINTGTPGQVAFNWTNNTPTTVADGTAIFEICFTVSAATGTLPVTFAATPAPAGTASGSTTVTVTTTPGAVTVQSAPACTGLALLLSNVSAQMGETVCVDVRVQDFINIIGMQFSVNYNASILQFNSLTNLGLPGLTLANFNTMQAGAVAVSWFDPALTGVTLPNNPGGPIFTMCFTVIGNASTELTITNTPTPIEIVNVANMEITPCTEGGLITIGNVPTPQTTTVAVGTATAAAGAQVCLPVRVTNFTNMQSLAFTVNYTPAQLGFVSVGAFNLAGLSAAQINTATPGQVAFNWTNSTPTTVADGTAIFEICFTVSATTGTLPVTFAATPAPAGTASGSAIVTVATTPGAVTVEANNQPPAITDSSVINVSCNGDSDGTISITLVSGVGPFQYNWGPGAPMTALRQNLSAGTYSVTVTDQGTGLTTSESFTITQPNPLVATQGTITNVNCAGQPTGSISINVTGGTPTYSLSWSGTLPDNQTTQSNIGAGTYAVTVSDSRNCITTLGGLTVTEPALLTVSPQSITNVTCAGNTNGAITIAVGGGTPTYGITWSGGLAPNVTTQSNLAAGQYGVTVVDALGCTATFGGINVNSLNPAVTVQSIVATNISGGMLGGVNLTASAGGAALTYNWSGPNGFSATTEDLSGLTVPGQYCVTVTGPGGCTNTPPACATVAEVLAVNNGIATRTCPGTSSGAITITVGGNSIGATTYEWRMVGGPVFSTQQNVSGLAAGSYTVMVTNNGQTVSATFDVGTFPAMVVTPNVTNATMGANGSINLNISGSAAPYGVAWQDGNTSNPRGNLAPGEYCATITDGNGCTTSACYTLVGPPLAFANQAATPAACNGQASGAFTASISGGIEPYTLTMDGQAPVTNQTGTFNITGLAAGDYEYTISDAAGASVSNTVTITAPSPVTYTATHINDTQMAGTTGSITLNINGGTPTYTVGWNIAAVGPQIFNLPAGTYTPTIIDAAGCTLVGDPVVIAQLGASAVTTNASCVGDANGAIDVTLEGVDEATYSWTVTGTMAVIGTTPTITGLAPSSYTVRITDNTGAVLVRTFTVSTRSAIQVSAMVTSGTLGFALSCADGSDGRALATANNGVDPVNYEWEQAGQLVSTGAALENATAGTYTVIAIDELGCEAQTEITLTAPSPLQLLSNQVPISCVGENDGEIVVSGVGGIGNLLYVWSHGDLGTRVTDLAPGAYTVTVTDANDCALTESFSVQDATPIQVVLTTTPATDGCNGSVQAIVTGGSGMYQYKWVNVIANPNESMVNNLCPGDYFLEVTDTRGCENLSGQVVGSVEDRRFPCLSERNVITPNGDGSNDEFIIFCAGELPNNQLQIYNRWGQLVFETTNYDNSWSGTSRTGQPLPEGPYYFVLTYDGPDGPVQIKSSLTILRD